MSPSAPAQFPSFGKLDAHLCGKHNCNVRADYSPRTARDDASGLEFFYPLGGLAQIFFSLLRFSSAVSAYLSKGGYLEREVSLLYKSSIISR